MCNVVLYGYGEEEDKIVEIIRETLLGLGFDGSDAVITVMYNGMVEDLLEEGIQLIGYDIDAAVESHELDNLPIGTNLVDSYTGSIGSDSGIEPYVAVFASSSKRLKELVKELKARKICIDIEGHLITPLKEYKYPCIRVLSNEESELVKVAMAIEQRGFRVYEKMIDFEPAIAM